jgi:hypothetical protein
LVAKTRAAEALSVTVADSVTETGMMRVGLIESVPVAVSARAALNVLEATVSVSVAVAVSAMEETKL